MPTDKGKGTLVSTTTHGNVMIGPNAEKITDKENNDTTRAGLTEIINNSKKLLPSLNEKDVIAQFAGLRPKGNQSKKDFVVEIAEKVKGLINLAGIESPGLVSAPAIANRVEELLIDAGEKLKEKKEWNGIRMPPPCFKKLSHNEREKLVKKNPLYGRIVCRCEEITEGEIIDAIKSPVPAMTYDAIKRRLWLGTGRCQGAFDYPRVIEILSRELGIHATKVTKKGRGSEFLYRETKEIL